MSRQRRRRRLSFLWSLPSTSFSFFLVFYSIFSTSPMQFYHSRSTHDYYSSLFSYFWLTVLIFPLLCLKFFFFWIEFFLIHMFKKGWRNPQKHWVAVAAFSFFRKRREESNRVAATTTLVTVLDFSFPRSLDIHFIQGARRIMWRRLTHIAFELLEYESIHKDDALWD